MSCSERISLGKMTHLPNQFFGWVSGPSFFLRIKNSPFTVPEGVIPLPYIGTITHLCEIPPYSIDHHTHLQRGLCPLSVLVCTNTITTMSETIDHHTQNHLSSTILPPTYCKVLEAKRPITYKACLW
jgi:hypothetical protein